SSVAALYERRIPFWKAHTKPVWLGPRGSAFGGQARVCYKGPRRLTVIATTPAACAPPKLNNRSGPASDESIQGEGVKTGCVDTIVNDVRFFLDKYENGESDRWN